MEVNVHSCVTDSRSAIETLIQRNRFQWIYYLLPNLFGHLLDPRNRTQWEWTVYTVVNILLCLLRLPLDVTITRPGKMTPRMVRLWLFIAVFHSFCLSAILSVGYRKYGIDQPMLVGTVAIMAFTLLCLSLNRSNLRFSTYITIAFLLMPALTAISLRTPVGYGIAIDFLATLIFCLHQAHVSNREYWKLLHLNRDLQIARREAESAGNIKAELLAQQARQSAIAGERARIAAEWHDTLLAGFSAISWQIDVAQSSLPKNVSEAAQALKLAGTILNHYRSESRLVISGMQSGNPEHETLPAALSRTLSSLAEGRAVKLEVTAEGGLVSIADTTSHQLIRICHEAVSNALKHAAAQTIKVKIREQEFGVCIEIQDDGVGFNSDFVPSGHYGLEIMKERARRLGGTLEIQSQPGAGTTLTVQIPLIQDGSKLSTSVLIIEDQFFSRVALRSVLDTAEDFAILGEANTGAAGIELFRRHKPDITILDLCLPDTTGFEVIRTIRGIDPLASILVVSNLDDAQSIRLATETGASAFLSKNASSRELLHAIAAVVAGKTSPPLPMAEGISSVNHGAEVTRELLPRERDVLEQLVIGLNSHDIGLHLGISEKAVRTHMANVLSKLGVADLTEATAIALQRGLVELPSHSVA